MMIIITCLVVSNNEFLQNPSMRISVRISAKLNQKEDKIGHLRDQKPGKQPSLRGDDAGVPTMCVPISWIPKVGGTKSGPGSC